MLETYFLLGPLLTCIVALCIDRHVALLDLVVGCRMISGCIHIAGSYHSYSLIPHVYSYYFAFRFAPPVILSHVSYYSSIPLLYAALLLVRWWLWAVLGEPYVQSHGCHLLMATRGSSLQALMACCCGHSRCVWACDKGPKMPGFVFKHTPGLITAALPTRKVHRQGVCLPPACIKSHNLPPSHRPAAWSSAMCTWARVALRGLPLSQRWQLTRQAT